jgi:hypothetical protein
MLRMKICRLIRMREKSVDLKWTWQKRIIGINRLVFRGQHFLENPITLR